MIDLDRIINTMIIAAVCSSLANVLAQLVACQQNNTPITIDMHSLRLFVTFAELLCIPNLFWQEWLEEKYPARIPLAETSESSSTSKVAGTNPTLEPESKTSSSIINLGEESTVLSYKNTIVKFLLDQTLGALINTAIFVAGMRMLHGERSIEVLYNAVRNETWGLFISGKVFWPLISLICYAVVPIDWRGLVMGVAGVAWGAYSCAVEASAASRGHKSARATTKVLEKEL